MNRITLKFLEAKAGIINRITKSPEASYTKKSDGSYKANIGNYHLSGAYGGVCLHRMQSDGGGVSDVFSCGHVSKRELAIRMDAFIAGIQNKRD